MRKTPILLAALLLFVSLVGVAAAQEASVTAEPQVTQGEEVLIAEAVIDGDGFVAVHTESATGEYSDDTVIGATAIDEGSHSDVTVELDEAIEDDQILFAALYFGVGEFDIADVSAVEVEDEDGNLVEVYDSFFVVIGDPDDEDLGDTYRSLAENEQQKHDFQREIQRLRDRLDELEDSDDEDVQQQKDDIRDQIDELEGDVSTLEAEIEETRSVLADILELREQLADDTDDEEPDDGEGLPGFTAIAGLLAVLGVALLARRS